VIPEMGKMLVIILKLFGKLLLNVVAEVHLIQRMERYMYAITLRQDRRADASGIAVLVFMVACL